MKINAQHNALSNAMKKRFKSFNRKYFRLNRKYFRLNLRHLQTSGWLLILTGKNDLSNQYYMHKKSTS